MSVRSRHLFSWRKTVKERWQKKMAKNFSRADVTAICEFLGCPTPTAWLEQAIEHKSELLIDHANCEKKAAGNAMSLLYRYVDRPELLDKLSKLAREELLHFEQVIAYMRTQDIDYVHITPATYAASLRGCIATHEPWRLVDTLIVGAVVEARSCERFYRLTEVFDDELGAFYGRLLASEARHFKDYLSLAEHYAPTSIEDRVQQVLDKEAEIIALPAEEFRFHSGPLA